MEDDFLVMDQNDCDSEDEAEFHNVHYDITDDEYDELPILQDSEIFLSS